MVAPHTIQLVMTLSVGGALAVLAVAAAVVCVRHRTALYLLILLGGGVCMFNETTLDIIGACWFPSHGDWRMYTTLGRPVPVWVALAYFAYFGGLTAVTVYLLQRGLTRRQIWTGLGVIWALNVLLEIPPLYRHLYTYYGEQPLRLGKFPVVWLVFNSLGSFLAAALIFRFLPLLRGRRMALAVLVPPVSQYAAAWVGVPYFAAIQSSVGHGWRVVAALVTLALGLAALHGLVVAVSDRGDPPRPDDAVAEAAHLPALALRT